MARSLGSPQEAGDQALTEAGAGSTLGSSQHRTEAEMQASGGAPPGMCNSETMGQGRWTVAKG